MFALIAATYECNNSIMLKYKVIKQRNSLGSSQEEMYYPRLTGRRNIGLDFVAHLIGRRSTVSKADIVAVLASFEELIPELLIEGSSVKLGKLGTFSIHARAQASADASQISWRNFKEVNIRFKAGKALKLSLADVNFQKSES